MITKLKPIGQRVLIQADAPEQVTPGGIILIKSTQEKQDTATVIEVGIGDKDEEGRLIEFHVKKGDRVIYNKAAGTRLTVNKKEVLLISESDLLATING